ncbi:deoxyguanosinetriphosphate triphosphohydrolase family protein [Cellulosimicrobium sp. CUA-896]|uniref:deoxyguanosinetriphosphate triphosphohydrolase family protein n=1 Tax=Cellulosimicrobium sp. CUA-896 TaxID=1517881 RepID=UPI00096A8E82|nr:dNTP triphosphohydrolase [Cellulosimicrobium sp. CUA-896]
MEGAVERRSGRSTRDPSFRSETLRDRDRILYSDSFRRLGGVTQVAIGDPSMALHNRMTHSLKVEQVGFSLYSKLTAQPSDVDADPDAIRAACLAHDLGHPPFGHAGEQELDRLVVCPEHREGPRTFERRAADPCPNCLLEDGFEGNAQSFRILTALAVHRESPGRPIGLDLTRRSLAATTKYPWTRGTSGRKQSKWGGYDCDAGALEWALGSTDADPTLDAQIMDWADDISYAVHDVEDFFRASLVPVDDYKSNTETLDILLEYVESPRALGPLTGEVKDALTSMLEFFPAARFSGRTEDLAALDRLRGVLLTQFINAASVDAQALVREPIQERLNSILKQLIWFHIIDDPTLSNIQAGQRRVLREIFEALRPVAEEAYGSGGTEPPGEQALRRLPYGLRRAIGVGLSQESGYTLRQKIVRGLLDYIAGLSDSEAYHLHAVLRGREHAGQLHRN